MMEQAADIFIRYWRQRYDLFSLYDDGIHLTDAAWFGVTAEPIALQIAAELAEKSPSPKARRPGRRPRCRKVIIDLFAGAGGNTIAFALQSHWDLVIGIEIDAPTLACAQHNAQVYGAADLGNLVWVHGDCMDFLRRLRHFPETLARELRVSEHDDVHLFASPPWGGPMYSGDNVLDLDAMAPYGVGLLHERMRPMAHAMFLPRNGDLNQLASLVSDTSDEKLDVVQYCINGSCKGMVAYYPAEPEAA
ncbi:unnamed protein product [Discula destructiva]